MRVVHMGTPALSACILEKLADVHDVVAVVTQPDAVRGRGKKLTPSPVRERAETLGLPVIATATLRDAGVIAQLEALAPDCICVAAYGAILPPEVLEIPRFGCLNVHTSLLPRWRGAAPMQRAIMSRDEKAGLCIMRMDEGLDTGPWCRRFEFELGERYHSDVEELMAHEGARELLRALEAVQDGTAQWTNQSSEGVTYAQKLVKGELDLSPDAPAAQLCANVRASGDACPARTVIAGRSLAVLRARVLTSDESAELAFGLACGQAALRGKRLVLMASDGAIEVQEVKPDGKKAMDARAFSAGIQGIKNGTITWGTA